MRTGHQRHGFDRRRVRSPDWRIRRSRRQRGEQHRRTGRQRRQRGVAHRRQRTAARHRGGNRYRDPSERPERGASRHRRRDRCQGITGRGRHGRWCRKGQEHRRRGAPAESHLPRRRRRRVVRRLPRRHAPDPAHHRSLTLLRSPLRFSRDSYQNLVRRIDRSDPHPTLIGGEKWYPPEEQIQQDAKADAELAATGWPVRDFADVIGLLQRPSVDRYCWARINGRDVTLQAAAARRDAILAVADDDTITLFPSTAESAARELVSALPGTPPASNLHSLSCSEADYSAVLAGNPPPTRTNSARDARRAVEWMQAPRIHVGRLYVAIRRGTERVRNEHPPYWIDAEQGRFTAAVTDGWLSISPAGADDLARMLHTIEAGLRA
ncbi:hypothetical protein DMP23_32355 [Amycolatopsis sp. A1MSW2902]